ncbi:DC-STAMP domain-containing protein 2-like [Asbolus verrucosus]|uniref:DC-STAMP domain-containing protein 2-like n=1 Tax=Asbolus verrucosus TaxID=1661398 RepID=A0A482VMN8_ASBVE|nr:DC-STAMP domain-containing protein 2-like [Asbolus verrucosus]
MAHLRLFCTALGINRVKNDLIKEKTDCIGLQHQEAVRLTLRQRWRHCCLDLRLRLKRCCSLPEDSRLHRLLFRLKRDGSFENYVLKSVLGFVGGFVLTYVFFMFFVVQLNFKLSTATMMCSVFGSVLMLGLAFSRHIRCIVFLTLPQFFSKRGRQALLAYAFILAITGPAKNTLNNMGILSESLACGQEQLKSAVKQIIDVIKKPFYAIRDAIKSVVKTVKAVVKKIKDILLKIKRIIVAILKVIKAAFQFLGKILNICNKELGTPFQRCSRVFENAITDCYAKLGPWFSWLCSVAYLVQSVCYIVKIFDYVCMLVDFISDSVIGVVVRSEGCRSRRLLIKSNALEVKSFIRHVRTMFYVRIKFSHSFHFHTNSSKSYSEVAKGIVTEIKERTEGLAMFFDFVSLFTSFFFVFLIVNERSDNKYITRNFREIDLQRAKFGKETILPLNHRERKLYISVSSCRLVKTEKRKLAQSAVVLGVATLKLGSHMLVDYSLFWVLNLIRYHGRFQSKVKAPNLPTVKIEGEGLLADLLKSIVKAFKPLGVELEIDTIPCLPNPIPPDYDRYIQIGSLLVLCWILTLLEPYGLRLRHSIMCYYHPVRAKQRAVWLYNHIMRSRLTFLKLARRQLRRNVLGQKGVTRITCKEFLRAKLNCRVCRICLGADKQEACLLCGEVFRESDEIKPIKCATPDCPGVYCRKCFNDLQNLCTVCLSPIEYGDMSDISEEKGSDDDDDCDPPKRRPPKKNKSNPHSVEEGRLLFFEEDSGHSSDSSQHSYTYQYEKTGETSAIEFSKPAYRDSEKQKSPEYASMDSFREIERENAMINLLQLDQGPSLKKRFLGLLGRGQDSNQEELELMEEAHASLNEEDAMETMMSDHERSPEKKYFILSAN